MSGLRNSILATITYHDALNLPLTAFEIDKFLINPKRINQKLGDFKLSNVLKQLESLEKKEIIESKYGFYFLSSRGKLANERINRQKIADKKWKLTRRAIKFLNMVPYVSAVFGSGSLAMNNTTDKSDLDVLIVVKNGRIWTTRFLISALLSALGVRRTKFHNIAPDKVCLNHYVTDTSLAIPYRSMYNAQTYARLVPILIRDESVTSNFKRENNWIKEYLANWTEDAEFHLKTLPADSKLKSIADFMEDVLDGKLGNTVEQYLKKIQLKRIENDPNTYKKGGRVTFDDMQLEFHPDSPERRVIDRYNKNLVLLGINSIEKDSGLIPDL